MSDVTIRAVCEMIVALCVAYTAWKTHRNGEATVRVGEQVKEVPEQTKEKIVKAANGSGVIQVSPAPEKKPNGNGEAK